MAGCRPLSGDPTRSTGLIHLNDKLQKIRLPEVQPYIAQIEQIIEQVETVFFEKCRLMALEELVCVLIPFNGLCRILQKAQNFPIRLSIKRQVPSLGFHHCLHCINRFIWKRLIQDRGLIDRCAKVVELAQDVILINQSPAFPQNSCQLILMPPSIRALIMNTSKLLKCWKCSADSASLLSFFSSCRHFFSMVA